MRAIAIPVASLREEVGPAAAARGAKGGHRPVLQMSPPVLDFPVAWQAHLSR